MRVDEQRTQDSGLNHMWIEIQSIFDFEFLVNVERLQTWHVDDKGVHTFQQLNMKRNGLISSKEIEYSLFQ